MPTTPESSVRFPRDQVFVSVGPGSYIVLSKTPYDPASGIRPRPQTAGTAQANSRPPWVTSLAHNLNTALVELNHALLKANERYQNGAEPSQAVSEANVLGKIKDSLNAIDSQLHGFFWPPARPPFRGGRADYVESDQFPIKEDLLPPNHKGYVIFRCDSVEVPGTRERRSWGYCRTFSMCVMNDGGSEEICRGVSDRRRPWGECDPSGLPSC